MIVTSLGRCCCPGSRVPQSPNCCTSSNVGGKLREGGEDDEKGIVSDVEGVRSLGGTGNAGFHEGWYLCLCGGGGGCGCGCIDGSSEGGGVDGNGGSSGVGDSGESNESIVYRSGGGGGSIESIISWLWHSNTFPIKKCDPRTPLSQNLTSYASKAKMPCYLKYVYLRR